MSILLKNKVASAIAATILIASAPSFAENLIPEGDLESLNMSSANLGFKDGPKLADGTTQSWGQIGAGWCRFINDTITGNKAGVPEHAPAGNTSNVAYCNHKRNDDNGGIYRAVEGLEIGKNYRFTATGATRGSLQMAIEYTKVGSEEVTNIDLSEVVVSDLTWVEISDSFSIPADADLTKQFRVYIHTQPSEMYSSTEVTLTERSLMWVDNFQLEEIASLELFPNGDLETLTGFTDDGSWGHGNLAFNAPGSIYLTTTVDGVEVPLQAYGQFGPEWARFINNERWKVTGPGGNKMEEHAPPGNDTNVAFWNHTRTLHSSGIYREVQDLQPGHSYKLAADGATLGSLQLAYRYTKIGAPIINDVAEVTAVVLSNTIASNYEWVTIEDTFIAPMDMDVNQSFKIIVRTAETSLTDVPAALKNTVDSRMWVDNFSLMGPPAGKDTDVDGVYDIEDAFPEDPAAAVDTDGDGMPDDFLANCDQACLDATQLILDDDDDNDGVLDVIDGYPQDDTKSVIVNIGPETSIFIANTTVTIDASTSVPSSADGVYTWLQLSGTPVTLSADGETVSFTAPDVMAREESEVELTIDGAADTQSALYSFSVIPTPAAVTINATMSGMSGGGSNLIAGDIIVLDASASTDSEGRPLTFKWEQIGGRWDQKVSLENADTAVATFTVPVWNDDLPIVFQVTVQNDQTWPAVDPTAEDTATPFETSSDTLTIDANLVKKESPVPDGGSIAFIGMMLLGGLSLVRRLVNVKK